MDEHTSHEQAYKNGYEKGKQDAMKWMPRNDPPKTMGKYLCRYVFGKEVDYVFEQVLWYYANLEKPHFQHEGNMGLRVTHWMPLPTPPKGE